MPVDAKVRDALDLKQLDLPGGALKASVSKGLPAGSAVPEEIRQVATAFLTLQEKRNQADYDLTEDFRRSDVLFWVDQAEAAIARFQSLPSSNEKKFFLRRPHGQVERAL